MSASPTTGRLDETATLPLPTDAWLVVALLCVVAGLNYLDRVILTTMRESLTAAIPMTEAQFGLLTSTFVWVYGGLSPLAGFLADRFSRSRVIIGSLFLWSLSTWLTSHSTSFHQLLATRVLMGITEACYLPAALALIVDYHRGATRSLATGLHLCGLSVGSGLGGLGGWLAERHGWSYPFSLFGTIGIGYSVILLLKLRDAPASGQQPAPAEAGSDVGFVTAMRSLASHGSFWLMFFYWGLIGLVGWAVLGWMPTYLQQEFHLSQGEAGISATSYLQITTLLGYVVGGLSADRWNQVAKRGRIYLAASGMCVAAPAILLVALTHSFGVAITGLMIFGFARACCDCNTMPILCMVCDPRYRATGFGVINLFSMAVGGFAIYAGGMLRDAHINVSHIFVAGAIGLLICAGLLALVQPIKASEPPAAKRAGWEQTPPLPEPAAGFMAGAIDGKIIVAGGTNWRDATKRWLDNVWRFDPETREWETGPSLPHPVAYAASASDESRLYFAGGADGNQGRREIYALDSQLTAKHLADLPRASVYAGGAILNGKLCLFGGGPDPVDWSQVTNALTAVTLGSQSTSTLPPLSELSHGLGIPAVAAVGGSLYVFTGAWRDRATEKVQNEAAAFAYDAPSNSWRNIAEYPKRARGVSAVALDDHRIYLAGGYGADDEGFLAVAFIYDTKSDAYQPAMPLPMAVATCLVKCGPHIYALGGEDQMKHRTAGCFRIAVEDLLAGK